MGRVLTCGGTGGSEPDHYMISATDAPYRFAAQVTVSAWVNFTDLSVLGSTSRDICSKLSNAFTDGWGLRRESSNLTGYIYSASAGAYKFAQGTAVLPIGVWLLCTTTYDGQYLRTWINDQLNASLAQTGAIGTGSGTGVLVNGTTGGFGGIAALIEDIRLSGMALSPNQIGDLYRTNKWPDSVPLASWWRCLGTSGDSIEYDYSGNGNILSPLVGPPTVITGPSPRRFQKTNMRQVMFSQGAGAVGPVIEAAGQTIYRVQRPGWRW